MQDAADAELRPVCIAHPGATQHYGMQTGRNQYLASPRGSPITRRVGQGPRAGFSCCLGDDRQLPAKVLVLVARWRTTVTARQLNDGLPLLRMCLSCTEVDLWVLYDKPLSGRSGSVHVRQTSERPWVFGYGMHMIRSGRADAVVADGPRILASVVTT
jgi:hypothetical protein